MLRQSIVDSLLRRQPNVNFHITSVINPQSSELHIHQLSPDYRFVIDSRASTTSGEHDIEIAMSQAGMMIKSSGRIKVRTAICTSPRRNKVKIDVNVRKNGDYIVTVMVPANTSALVSKSETITSQEVVGEPQETASLMEELSDMFDFGGRRPFTSTEDLSDTGEEQRRTNEETVASNGQHASPHGKAQANGHSSNGNGQPHRPKKTKRPQAKKTAKGRRQKKNRGGGRKRRHAMSS